MSNLRCEKPEFWTLDDGNDGCKSTQMYMYLALVEGCGISLIVHDCRIVAST